MATAYSKGQDLAIKICEALDLNPDIVSRIILDFNAADGGPVWVYVQMIASNEMLEIDWSALKGMHIEIVGDEPEMLICEQCGEAKPDIEIQRDPYDYDVNGTVAMRSLCKDCVQQLCDDI